MYDTGKIIMGVVIFLVLFTLPLWYSQASGDADYVPDPQILPEAGDQCVESADYMKNRHMELLDDWRHSVVRGADRVYHAEDGKEWDKSLTDTCLDCHSNYEDFCVACHDYVDVRPKCWECHVDEGE